MAGFSYNKPYVHPLSKQTGPVATGGKVQPLSGGRKTVKVKAHTRTIVSGKGDLGYLSNDATSIKKFQKFHSLPVTGRWDPTTQQYAHTHQTRLVSSERADQMRAQSGPPGTGGAVAPNDQALIDAAIRTRYGPAEQALNAQLGQNARFTSGLPAWYQNAQDEIRGLQAQGQAQAQQTLGQITNYNSQPTLANANDQQAATARNNLNSEFAAQFGRDATANSDAMNRLAAAYGIQQGNTLNAANAERMGLLGKQGQLGQEKADYGLTYGNQLAQSEAKALTDQQKVQLAAKALGIKVDTLKNVQEPLAQSLIGDRTNKQKVARTNARTKQKALEEKTATDNSALEIKRHAANTKATGDPLKRSQFIAKYGLTPEKVAKMSPGQLSHFATKNPQFEGYARPPAAQKAKPLTQGQAKGRQGLLDAITRYQTGVKHGEALHKIAADGRKNKVNEAVLHAGADAVSHGYITPATVALLEQIGYSVPKEWTRKGAFPVTYK